MTEIEDFEYRDIQCVRTTPCPHCPFAGRFDKHNKDDRTSERNLAKILERNFHICHMVEGCGRPDRIHQCAGFVLAINAIGKESSIPAVSKYQKSLTNSKDVTITLKQEE